MEQKILIPVYIEYLKDIYKRDKKEIMEYMEKKGFLTFHEPMMLKGKPKKKTTERKIKDSEDLLPSTESKVEPMKPKGKKMTDTLDEPSFKKWNEQDAFVRFKRLKHMGDEKAMKAWSKLNIPEQKKF
jgi:hypothetical protein